MPDRRKRDLVFAHSDGGEALLGLTRTHLRSSQMICWKVAITGIWLIRKQPLYDKYSMAVDRYAIKRSPLSPVRRIGLTFPRKGDN